MITQQHTKHHASLPFARYSDLRRCFNADELHARKHDIHKERMLFETMVFQSNGDQALNGHSDTQMYELNYFSKYRSEFVRFQY